MGGGESSIRNKVGKGKRMSDLGTSEEACYVLKDKGEAGTAGVEDEEYEAVPKTRQTEEIKR